MPTRAESFGAGFVEFMVVGGATLFLFPLAWLLRTTFGLDDAEFAAGFLTFYGAYVINDPHFAVTYLLFYKDFRQRAFGSVLPRAQRVRYVVVGAVVPLSLGIAASVAIGGQSAPTLGWMIQLMFLLVGWHYAKQGFGVLTVLSARRGVRISVRERTIFLAHCYAAWAYAWSSPSVAAGQYQEKGVVYSAVAHPRWLEFATGGALAVSSVALVWVLVARWRREGTTLPLAPLTGFLITIWSWTIYSSADPVLRYLIPALHSVQYFYFVWLMKRNEARESEGPPTFGRPASVRVGFLAVSAIALGWLLLRGGPELLDGIFVAKPSRGAVPDDLGLTPFFAALYVFVNVHHYFMDNVIWRRDNPDTRYMRLADR